MQKILLVGLLFSRLGCWKSLLFNLVFSRQWCWKILHFNLFSHLWRWRKF
jgi:hypothetical protein